MKYPTYKVGDRVAVYNHDPKNKALGSWTGEILWIGRPLPCGVWLTVKLSTKEVIVHSKQCRLLKKKTRRRIWIDPLALEDDKVAIGECIYKSKEQAVSDAIEFIQVKKK